MNLMILAKHCESVSQYQAHWQGPYLKNMLSEQVSYLQPLHAG